MYSDYSNYSVDSKYPILSSVYDSSPNYVLVSNSLFYDHKIPSQFQPFSPYTYIPESVRSFYNSQIIVSPRSVYFFSKSYVGVPMGFGSNYMRNYINCIYKYNYSGFYESNWKAFGLFYTLGSGLGIDSMHTMQFSKRFGIKDRGILWAFKKGGFVGTFRRFILRVKSKNKNKRISSLFFPKNVYRKLLKSFSRSSKTSKLGGISSRFFWWGFKGAYILKLREQYLSGFINFFEFEKGLNRFMAQCNKNSFKLLKPFKKNRFKKNTNEISYLEKPKMVEKDILLMFDRCRFEHVPKSKSFMSFMHVFTFIGFFEHYLRRIFRLFKYGIKINRVMVSSITRFIKRLTWISRFMYRFKTRFIYAIDRALSGRIFSRIKDLFVKSRYLIFKIVKTCSKVPKFQNFDFERLKKMVYFDAGLVKLFSAYIFQFYFHDKIFMRYFFIATTYCRFNYMYISRDIPLIKKKSRSYFRSVNRYYTNIKESTGMEYLLNRNIKKFNVFLVVRSPRLPDFGSKHYQYVSSNPIVSEVKPFRYCF